MLLPKCWIRIRIRNQFALALFITVLPLTKGYFSDTLVKGYECPPNKPYALIQAMERWSKQGNDDMGINVVFLLHNSKHSLGNFMIQLTQGIVQYIRVGTNNWYRHHASIFIHTGPQINKLFYNEHRADEFLSEIKWTTFKGQGSNVSGALDTVKELFKVHTDNRPYGRNICFLLMTSPPDSASGTAKKVKMLHDLGISTIVIGVGTSVTRADIETLASNKNAVFITHPGDIKNMTSDDLVTRVAGNVTSVLRFAQLLPRYGMCYEGRRNFYIVVDVKAGHVEIMEQLSKFISKFGYRNSIQVKMMNDPITDGFQHKYRKQNRWVTFKTDREINNVFESTCREFNDSELIDADKILILVMDHLIKESKVCEMAGIHVMELGVGTHVDEDHLNRFIGDSRGKEIVQDTGDVFWGLQLLNRKLCPAVCDKHWVYHNGMCYNFQRNSVHYSWSAAKDECSESNARLVSITTVEKFNWLVQQFSLIADYPIYIGLKKSDVGDAPIYRELRWENGEPLVFSNWSHSNEIPQPDGGLNEACVGWYPDGWHDIGCMFTIASCSWICEREANNVSKPELVGVQVRPLWEETPCPIFNALHHKEREIMLNSGFNCSNYLSWSHSNEIPQPDGGLNEACVGWYPDGWHDIGCMFTIASCSWICEREANNVSKPELVGVQVRPLWEETPCPIFNALHHKEREIMLNSGFNCSSLFDVLFFARNWHMMINMTFKCRNGEFEFNEREIIILFSGVNCSPVYDVFAFAGTSYVNHTFNCSNGELISILLLCDGVEHCTDASDEKGCPQIVTDTCADSQFRCNNGRCVSLAYLCDFWDDCGDNSDETTCDHVECPSLQCDNGQCFFGMKLCDLHYDCFDKSDERNCFGEYALTSCYDGTIIPTSWRKDGTVDCTGTTMEDEVSTGGIKDMNLCYTGRYQELYYLIANKRYKLETTECTMMFDGYGKHLETSDITYCYGKSTICPIGFYLCPSGFCIPIERVCDGKMDCIHGEEEIGCENYVCPGYFRCPGTNTCFHPTLVCDGDNHCPGGRDEVLCHVTCPQNCKCQGGYVHCHHDYNFSSPLPPSTRKLVLKKQFSSYMNDALTDLRYLFHVDFSGIDLPDINGVFDNQVNLQFLNLSRNNIDEISKFVFVNLENLKVLDLSYNRVHNIKSNSFSGLKNLNELYINNNRLSKLSAKSFVHLVKLEYLNMKNNVISLVESGAFTGLTELSFLHFDGNAIYQFDKGVYNGLVRIREIHTDAYTLCCPKVRPPSVKEDRCVAPKQSISSCDDLMANNFLRASIWVLCISALVGNIVTIGMRCLLERESMKNGFGVFVSHLCISDFLMGVYLMIIAVADTKYKGIYTWNDYDWRNSVYCKLAGFLATLSSETSAMFIFLITFDRFLVMKFPFGQVRFRFKSATICSICAWLVGVVFAAVPLMPSLKDWRFYSKNGACLALPFFTERVPGWIYSSLIFIGFNFVIFIFIALGQFIIYRTIINASMISSKKRMEQEMAIARRLFLIVLTDFLCWFPIGVMGLLALSGTEIKGEVYAWTAVFVLPVNSALNPFLYTIPAVLQKLRSKNGSKDEKTTHSEATRT